MSDTIRVIYGTEVDTTVDGTLKPEDIFNTLKNTYKELADGQFTVNTVDGQRVMKITLKEGRKAA